MDKHARHELNLWQTQEKAHRRTDQHDHQLFLQRECQEHEKDMKDKDLASLQLQLQIEQLRTQQLALRVITCINLPLTCWYSL